MHKKHNSNTNLQIKISFWRFYAVRSGRVNLNFGRFWTFMLWLSWFSTLFKVSIVILWYVGMVFFTKLVHILSPITFKNLSPCMICTFFRMYDFFFLSFYLCTVFASKYVCAKIYSQTLAKIFLKSHSNSLTCFKISLDIF